jgi:(p)ppGpp synthase/HD superfamily hydrolase
VGIMADLVQLARDLAHRAHAGQVDKAGRPYIEHVARVAERVLDDGRCCNEDCYRGEVTDWSTSCGDPSCCSPARWECESCSLAVAVAWLHDVCEDHPEYYSRMAEMMPSEVVRAVDALDRNIAGDYYQRIGENYLALRVKLADIADNADENRLALLPPDVADRLRKKYSRALAALLEAAA